MSSLAGRKLAYQDESCNVVTEQHVAVSEGTSLY
jgi:hypothetical protein